MKHLIFVLFLSSVYSEAPVPYQERGWKPTGTPFQLPIMNIPTRNSWQNTQTIPSKQYGFPSNNPAFSNGVSVHNSVQQAAQNSWSQDSWKLLVNQNNKISQQLPVYEARNFRSFQNEKSSTGITHSQPQNKYDNQHTFQTNEIQPSQQKWNQNQHNNNAIPTLNGQRPQQYLPLSNDGNKIANVQIPETLIKVQNSIDLSYGPPLSTTLRPTTTQRPNVTTRKPESTTNKNVEDYDEDDVNLDQPIVSVATAIANAGQYYVLLPDGRLQKVTYSTEQGDGKNKGITAKLMYENVEPIKGPIYTYTNTPLGPVGPLVQIKK